METNALSPQQRENLKNQLIRRLAKLDDATLIQLELFTRHPVRTARDPLEQSQPVRVARNSPPAEEAHPPSEPTPVTTGVLKTAPAKAHASGSAKVSRREALGFGLAGLFGMTAAAVGYGWYDSDVAYGELLDKVRKADEALDNTPALREAADSLAAEIDALVKLAIHAQQEKNTIIQQIENYNDDLTPAALKAMDQLKNATKWVDGFRTRPYVEEALDGLIALVKNRELKYFYDFLKAYPHQLDAIVAYLGALPTLFEFNYKAVETITPWLNHERGLAKQVIHPLTETLAPTIDELVEKTTAAEMDYQSTLMVQLRQMLESRERVERIIQE